MQKLECGVREREIGRGREIGIDRVRERGERVRDREEREG